MAPTDPIPIVRIDPRDGERELVMARWGLIPFWMKEKPKVLRLLAKGPEVAREAGDKLLPKLSHKRQSSRRLLRALRRKRSGDAVVCYGVGSRNNNFAEPRVTT